MAADVRDTPTKSVPLSFFSGVRYEHLVAGLSGGVVSTLATHPFDLIKLRFAGKTEFCIVSKMQLHHLSVISPRSS